MSFARPIVIEPNAVNAVWPRHGLHAPDVPLELIAGRTGPRLHFGFRDFSRGGTLINAAAWGMRIVVRRTIDGPALIDRDETTGAWTWIAADLVWRLELAGTITANAAPVSYPTLRPRGYERMIYAIVADPNAWPVPMPVRRFTVRGGECRVYTGE